MKYEVFTLGKHFLQVHTSKGFTLFANAKINSNGEVVSFTDKLVRRGGTWVIDTWKFLTVKAFPQNPIYCAVFGFEDDDSEVKVNATDIDVESISGVNGQLVDVGNISLVKGQSLPVNTFAVPVHYIDVQYGDDNIPINIPDLENYKFYDVDGILRNGEDGIIVNGRTKKIFTNVFESKISPSNPAKQFDLIDMYIYWNAVEPVFNRFTMFTFIYEEGLANFNLSTIRENHFVLYYINQEEVLKLCF